MAAIEKTEKEDSLFSDLDGFLSSDQLPDTLVVYPYIAEKKPYDEALEFLDWRLCGAVSRLVRRGKITGEKGEQVYLPLIYKGKKLSLLFLGVGNLQKESWTEENEKALVDKVKKIKKELKFGKLLFSKTSFSFLKKPSKLEGCFIK